MNQGVVVSMLLVYASLLFMFLYNLPVAYVNTVGRNDEEVTQAILGKLYFLIMLFHGILYIGVSYYVYLKDVNGWVSVGCLLYALILLGWSVHFAEHGANLHTYYKQSNEEMKNED